MDTLTSKERSRLMSRIRSGGNESTELRLMRWFREHHVRGWRRRYRLFGRPDFVFPKLKTAVFVDGCFWHGHPTLGRIPKTRSAFWRAKITRNKERDRLVNRTLRNQGWAVIRVWEHEVGGPRCRRKLRSLLHHPMAP